mmetsp:Transcript_39013/g.34695  ORF Transcript_39013/g.34695 Transcript_39013/m.34695 type:complete len:98 (+) Transcript_39013:416-709(+)
MFATLTSKCPLMDDLTFDVLIIDECAQALEVASLIRIVKCKKLIIVGDDKQLPPQPQNQVTADKGLNISLFERLRYIVPLKFVGLLNEQFRMNDNIM